MDLFENFRKNIQLLRIEKGYSANELSIELGFSLRRVSNFEQSHKPTSEELFIISKFFNIPTDDLVHKKAKVVFQ